MKKIFVALCVLSFFFYSCGDNKKVGSVRVDNFSNGKAGEVILILDNRIWTEEAREQAINLLTEPQPAINQIEPMFDLLVFQPADFTPIFQRHRSIVRFDIDTSYSTNYVDIEKNVWASPQVYVYIRSNNVDSALNVYYASKEDIISELYDNDLKRLQTVYRQNGNKKVEKVIKDKFGVSLTVPQHYFVAREEADFLWLRFRTARNDRFIMVYKTPMKELSEAFLLDLRDTITKQYIPGAVDNAYPIIARKLGFPIVNEVTLGRREGLEMRGLWESINDKMGGPFYSFSFLDASGENVITVDGFVYAPQEEKRDYLREVEAIVKTVQ